MPLQRTSYADLPTGVQEAVAHVTGAPLAVEAVTEGFNSAVAVTLTTAEGRYFVKALPLAHRWAWTQEREAAIAPHVRTVAPAICGRVLDEGWDVLIFEALQGHHADYAPGSPDLPHVAELLIRMSALPCPDIDLRQAEQRLQAYSEPASLHHFAGDALLHTDLNNANVIVSDGTARMVDWGWSTRGAAWLDAAHWVIWLIAAGHEPSSAERWASRVPAWRTAPAEGLTAFSVASARLWGDIGGEKRTSGPVAS